MRPEYAFLNKAAAGVALGSVVAIVLMLTAPWWARVGHNPTEAKVAEADPEAYIEKAAQWELWYNWGGGVYFFQKKSRLNQQDYWPYSLLRFLSENEGKKVVAMSDGNHDVMVVVFENKEEKK